MVQGEAVTLVITKTAGVSTSVSATITLGGAPGKGLTGASTGYFGNGSPAFTGGSGYAVNDVITLANVGGTQFQNSAATVKVLAVSSGGVITDWAVQRWGAYTGTFPSGFTQASTTGSGSGFTITNPISYTSTVSPGCVTIFSLEASPHAGGPMRILGYYATSAAGVIAPPLSLDVSFDGGAWVTPATQTIAGGVFTMIATAPSTPGGGHTFQLRDSCFTNHVTASLLFGILPALTSTRQPQPVILS